MFADEKTATCEEFKKVLEAFLDGMFADWSNCKMRLNFSFLPSSIERWPSAECFRRRQAAKRRQQQCSDSLASVSRGFIDAPVSA